MLDSARAIPLEVSGFGQNDLWAEAVNTASFLRIRLMKNSSVENITPFEIVHGYQSSPEHVQVFGSRAFVYKPMNWRTEKFDSTAAEGFLVGYPKRNAFRLYYFV